MTRTINEIDTELKALDQDRTMSTSLWMEVYVQLQHELRAAHKANDFDYDAAIATVTENAVSEWIAARETATAHERQWSIDLHALANGPMLVALIGAWFVGLMVVAIVLG